MAKIDQEPETDVDVDSFPEVMALVRAGDEQAILEVHRRWSRRLIRLARARLGQSMASKEDAEDVVQSVYKSFFRRFGDGNYQVEHWTEVWALLATIATRKCIGRRKHYTAIRRDARRETSMAQMDVPSSTPTAEEAALLTETIDRLLNEFDDETDCFIVRLSLESYSSAEIAVRVDRSERTVQRVRKHVSDMLETWNENDEARFPI